MEQVYPRQNLQKIWDWFFAPVSGNWLPVSVVASIVAVILYGLVSTTFSWITKPPHFSGTIVSERGTRSGVIIELSGVGRFANEGMSVWVPLRTVDDLVRGGGHLPTTGTSISVDGKTTDYHGHPEIVVNDIGQMHWHEPGDEDFSSEQN